MERLKAFLEKTRARIKNLNKREKIYYAAAAVLIVTVAVVVCIAVTARNRHDAKPVVASTTVTTTVVTTTAPTTQPPTTAAAKKLSMHVSSVQNDIRVRFYDESSKLITGAEFYVIVTAADGTTKEYYDANKVGKINIGKVAAGKYKVSLKPIDGFECEKPELEIVVKDKVEYKVIQDIVDDAKKANEVDEKKEDTTQKQTAQEEVLKDTVKFVESSKKVAYEYVPVEFAHVVSPQLNTTSSTDETGSMPETSSSTQTSTSEPTSTVDELRDTNNNLLYIKAGDTYTAAKAADYKAETQFYKYIEKITYTGWQEIEGSKYYFDASGNAVTGVQVIQGAQFDFGKSGALKKGTGVLGIDVSKWNGAINWSSVKKSGVSFAILRCAYRGYGSGAIVEDEYYKANIEGARAAGIDIGIYFFSQAINEAEAVEEASYCVKILNGLKIKYPIFIDIETSGGNGSGRADNLSYAQRTAVAKAFCKTVSNAGYKAGVYANKNYLTNKFDPSQLAQYYIWLAHYASSTNYAGSYDMWQYTSSGQVSGISGSVDMNFGYIY